MSYLGEFFTVMADEKVSRCFARDFATSKHPKHAFPDNLRVGPWQPDTSVIRSRILAREAPRHLAILLIVISRVDG